MKKRFLRFWNRIDSLDDRIYYAVITVGTIATLLSYVMGLVQRLPLATGITTLCCSLWMVVLLIVGVCRPKSLPVCRVVLVCGLNFVLLPIAYFACGGLTSGMVLFYMSSLFLTAALLHGRTRIVLFILSLTVLAYSLHYGWYHPELVRTLTPRQEYEDVIMTFCTTGISLGAMTIGILNAYNAERKHNQVLVEQLSNLSVRDALSGLYNRRELFRRLDLVYQPQQEERSERLKLDGCHIAMFDIDNFKALNDTYGHQFGDVVLNAVAQTLNDAVDLKRGEFAARYGGEEFVCVLYADSAEEAFARVDAARQAISELRWSKSPELTVTVSGGMVSCEERAPLDQAIHDVDMLLYEAKRSGKNCIVSNAKH